MFQSMHIYHSKCMCVSMCVCVCACVISLSLYIYIYIYIYINYQQYLNFQSMYICLFNSIH